MCARDARYVMVFRAVILIIVLAENDVSIRSFLILTKGVFIFSHKNIRSWHLHTNLNSCTYCRYNNTNVSYLGRWPRRVLWPNHDDHGYDDQRHGKEHGPIGRIHAAKFPSFLVYRPWCSMFCQPLLLTRDSRKTIQITDPQYVYATKYEYLFISKKNRAL